MKKNENLPSTEPKAPRKPRVIDARTKALLIAQADYLAALHASQKLDRAELRRKIATERQAERATERRARILDGMSLEERKQMKLALEAE